MKALKDNKDLLPKAVRVALDNHNGQELTIQEEGDQSSKDLVSASHKCRILTKRKIILQDKVTAAKESLRVQLQELQALDEQIKQAQKAVEECQSKLAQSMSGAGDVDADNRLGKQLRHSSSRRLHRVWALVLRLSRQNSCRPRLPHDRRQT